MKIHCLTVGMVETNGYILEQDGDAVIIDPGDEADRFVELVEAEKLNVHAILITHGHGDHIGEVGDLRKKYPQAPVYCHELDAPMLSNPNRNLSIAYSEYVNAGDPDKHYGDGDTLQFGTMKLEVRHVPGHTRGHVVFMVDGNLFAGDTLFAGSIGRFDLPGGNGELLLKKIHEKLLTMPDDTRVWPGHGPATTIGEERNHNPYLNPNLSFNALGW